MNKSFTLKVIDQKTKKDLVKSDVVPFCKQSLSVISDTIVNVNNEIINLKRKKYKTVIECSNDKFMSINNLEVGAKIIVHSMVLFSQVIKENMKMERDSAYDSIYVLNNNSDNASGDQEDSNITGNFGGNSGIHTVSNANGGAGAQNVKEISLKSKDYFRDNLGKVMMYSPKFLMTVTKIDIANVDMKNKWTLEAVE